MSLTVRQHLVPVFEAFGVDIVFAGHAHSYERTFPIRQEQPVSGNQETSYEDPDSPIYVVTGGGGAPLGEIGPSPFNAQAFSDCHIVAIEMVGDQLFGRAVDVRGQSRDVFQIRKPFLARLDDGGARTTTRARKSGFEPAPGALPSFDVDESSPHDARNRQFSATLSAAPTEQ